MAESKIIDGMGLRRAATISIVSLMLNMGAVRRGNGEERLDFKTLFYQESDDRIRVIAPSIEYEREFDNGFSLRIEGTYNAISGATPTGAPPIEEVVRVVTIPQVVTAPSAAPGAPLRYDDDDSDGDSDGGFEGGGGGAAGGPLSAPVFEGGAAPEAAVATAVPVKGGAPQAMAAATPAPRAAAPSPSAGGGGGSASTQYTQREIRERVPTDTVPKQEIDDTRIGLNLEVGKRLGRHKPSAVFALSLESDYRSIGVSLKDSIDFNRKNTTVLLGVGGTFDEVDGLNVESAESKTTYEAIAGITQVLTRKTLGTVNLSVGTTDGYLSDPYKFVEIDEVLYAENRPGSKDKWVLYTALTHHVERLNGSAEVSFRHYDDSFGIESDTLGLAWYQKIGDHLVVRPALRYYTQSAADFYGVLFAGAPQYYSSDYRVSAFDAIGYGLKLVVKPSEHLAFDIAFERYSQDGTDGVTLDDAYVSSSYLIMGLRLWL